MEATKVGYEKELNEYISQEKAAVDLISSVGNLMYGKSVELVFFRNHLLNSNISEVLRLQEYGKKVVAKPVSIYACAELAAELLKLDVAPSKIDIGKLAHEWSKEGDNFESKSDFLNNKLADFYWWWT